MSEGAWVALGVGVGVLTLWVQTGAFFRWSGRVNEWIRLAEQRFERDERLLLEHLITTKGKRTP